MNAIIAAQLIRIREERRVAADGIHVAVPQIDMLRMEDRLLSAQHFVSAATGAIEAYLRLHTKPSAAQKVSDIVCIRHDAPQSLRCRLP